MERRLHVRRHPVLRSRRGRGPAPRELRPDGLGEQPRRRRGDFRRGRGLRAHQARRRRADPQRRQHLRRRRSDLRHPGRPRDHQRRRGPRRRGQLGHPQRERRHRRHRPQCRRSLHDQSRHQPERRDQLPRRAARRGPHGLLAVRVLRCDQRPREERTGSPRPPDGERRLDRRPDDQLRRGPPGRRARGRHRPDFDLPGLRGPRHRPAARRRLRAHQRDHPPRHGRPDPGRRRLRRTAPERHRRQHRVRPDHPSLRGGHRRGRDFDPPHLRRHPEHRRQQRAPVRRQRRHRPRQHRDEPGRLDALRLRREVRCGHPAHHFLQRHRGHRSGRDRPRDPAGHRPRRQQRLLALARLP